MWRNSVNGMKKLMNQDFKRYFLIETKQTKNLIYKLGRWQVHEKQISANQ